MSVLALVGRPNTGKTSLFNALTGKNQRIANFAGTTVEKALGHLEIETQQIEVVDLPGVLSPLPTSEDQKVSLDFMDEEVKRNRHFAAFWVAEASNLEHDLSLALLFRRLGYPVSLVVNMMDEAKCNGLCIDLGRLSKKTGMRVIGTSAREGEGLGELRRAIFTSMNEERPPPPRTLDAIAPLELFSLQREAALDAKRIAREVISGFDAKERALPKIRQALSLDRFFLHPVLGPVFFFAVMLTLFNAIFSWAAPLTELINTGVAFTGEWISLHTPSPWLESFAVDGLLAGFGAVVVFVPQIAILFLLIGALEKTGYLPRAAALMDRLMRPFGLDGKVFVPLLSSFACAIPGIMATRTLESEKRRISTILLAPLMTCSARLPVYTLIISAFVPAQLTLFGLRAQGIVMTVMYLLAIVFAMLVALVLKKTRLYVRGGGQCLILPPFRLPRVKELLAYTWQRCAMFLLRAGKVIFAVSLVLWFLATFPRTEMKLTTHEGATAAAAAYQIEHSYLGRLGKAVQPFFAQLGYDWKLSVGILSAFAAREVFVGTLGTIYALGSVDERSVDLIHHLQEARAPDGSPLYTIATAVSLLVFFAIALQCMSTVAITRRETGGWKWPLIQMAYLWTFAYAATFLAYRVASGVLGL